MKTLLATLSIFLLIGNGSAKAQNNDSCACCKPEYLEFDFWLGEWDVYDTTGNMVGTNHITKLIDGCILQENWKSKGGTFIGSSYNYFDKTDKTWNQVWVDNQGGNLNLKGKSFDKGILMRSDKIKGQKVPFYYNQIIWTRNSDETITQVWEIFDEDSIFIQQLFKGIYHKK